MKLRWRKIFAAKPQKPIPRYKFFFLGFFTAILLGIIVLSSLPIQEHKQESHQKEIINVRSGDEIDGKDALNLPYSHYLLYFYQKTCSACQAFDPIVSEYIQWSFALPVFKIPLDDPSQWPYADQWRIEATPTLVEIKEKREVSRTVGVLTLEEMRQKFYKQK